MNLERYTAGGIMQKSKPNAHDIKKHPEAQREAMDEAREYSNPNRDRALGEADRTGRHFDEFVDASKENEAD
jgi:hypothetical protein